jgi:putative colanic acid biosynthesis UDP-glucose lipid carrier transferase
LSETWELFNPRALWSWGLLTPLVQWLGVLAGRWVIRRHAANVNHIRSAVILGASPQGIQLAEALIRQDQRAVDFIGFFDDRTDGRLPGEATHRLLGRLDEAARYITEFGIDEVYITVPLSQQPRLLAFLEQVQGTTASVYFVPDTFGIRIIQGRLDDLGGIPVVGLCETPFTGINALAKRASDIVLSLIIMTLVSPLLLLVAIGVKVSSPGPAIFRQKRHGLNGDEITVYKFRSMTTQDNGPEVKQATRGDSRITPFGAFIRRTSLDELPQFINVLQGSMSVVGPRPHAVAHNHQYRQLIKTYMVRHKVKPGITGWAQVNGHRGETDTLEKMQSRVECDLEYLRHWSLALDFQIIMKTIRLVFFDRNAY